MKEYSYKQIKRFDKYGIQFNDGEIIKFDDCRLNWSKIRGVNYEESFCVADRNISEEIPYFLFYANEEIKVTFKKTKFPWNNRYKKNFLKIQIGLNQFGYSSYDCT